MNADVATNDVPRKSGPKVFEEIVTELEHFQEVEQSRILKAVISFLGVNVED